MTNEDMVFIKDKRVDKEDLPKVNWDEAHSRALNYQITLYYAKLLDAMMELMKVLATMPQDDFGREEFVDALGVLNRLMPPVTKL